MRQKNIGILSSGADAPGVNAAIRAVTRSLIDKNYKITGYRNGMTGLLKNEFTHLRSGDVSGVLDRGGSILAADGVDDLLNKIFSDPDGGVATGIANTIKENMAMNDIEGLVIIGGNKTIRVADFLLKNDIKINIIPKSICNNICGTDTSIGFKTSVDTATEVIDKLHYTADSHHKIMLVEVSGKDTGWIVLEAGIAGGADIILIPEIPYDINKVARAVMHRKNNKRSFSIIVMAQSAVEKGKIQNGNVSSEPLCIAGEKGAELAAELANLINVDSDVTVLGQLLRGGRPSPYDRLLATRFGVYAAQLVLEGIYGKCICEQGAAITSEPIEKISGKEKCVNSAGDTIMTGKELDVCFGE